VSQDRERVGAFGFLTRLRTPADPSLGAVGAGSNAGPHFSMCNPRATGASRTGGWSAAAIEGD
jgi:hypothetical protein